MKDVCSFNGSSDQDGAGQANATRRYWLYRVDDNIKMWRIFCEEEIIGLPFDDLGDVKDFSATMDLRTKCRSAGQYEKEIVTYWVFRNRVKNGDVIVMRGSKATVVLGYGFVTSDYQYDQKRERYKHIHKMEWMKTGEWEIQETRMRAALINMTGNRSFVNEIRDTLGMNAAADIGMN